MKCIIIEGPQGCGKTTLANYLRENISAANFYRLSGQADKSIAGKEKSAIMYKVLLDYIRALENLDINLIFDRVFFSEQVYAMLGYKEYDFTNVYEELLERLGQLNYEIIYISLYLKDTNLYRTRLKRVHHDYHEFSIESSIDQQNAYRSLIPAIEKLDNTTVYEIAMDDFDAAYEQINEIFGIKNKQKEIGRR